MVLVWYGKAFALSDSPSFTAAEVSDYTQAHSSDKAFEVKLNLSLMEDYGLNPQLLMSL